jgi:septum formation protein
VTPLQIQKPLVLASGSPRRKQLLTTLGFDFTVEVRPTDEAFPDDMPAHDVPVFLAKQKAAMFEADIANRLVLCADTVVIVANEILNKPANTAEAYAMLRKLSGRSHDVVTGLCVLSDQGYETATDLAKVFFKELTDAEIYHYIDICKPFDKAGAYGIQEWIGMIAIERIEGSHYTIMGLPVHKVYEILGGYLGKCEDSCSF